MINSELERMWKEAVFAYLDHYPEICVEGLRKTTKNHHVHDSCYVDKFCLWGLHDNSSVGNTYVGKSLRRPVLPRY